jgi:hypothetical protein
MVSKALESNVNAKTFTLTQLRAQKSLFFLLRTLLSRQSEAQQAVVCRIRRAFGQWA